MDVFLAIVFWIVQAALAGLGAGVSIKPPQKRPQLVLLVACFVLLALIGGGVNVWQQIRAAKVQNDLQSQLDKIRNNTETPPQVTVNVPPAAAPVVNLPAVSHHTHIEYLSVPEAIKLIGLPSISLSNGKHILIPMAFRNAGDFTVQAPSDAGYVGLFPLTKSDESRSVDPKVIMGSYGALHFYEASGSILPRPSNPVYHTVDSPILSPEDTRKLESRDFGLCAVGEVRWRDETGAYRTRLAQCLVFEPDSQSFNWHSLVENNVEDRLK